MGITNTVNLIDGLDGLAAGTSAIASLCIAYVAYIHGMYLASGAMLALAGGALGFLPYNFYPARIFMGDGGSLFLGFLLSTMSILGPVKSATIVAVIIPVLVLGVPIFDTAFAIFRRLVNKRPIMEADKGHLHHRLMKLGYGQRRATLMLYHGHFISDFQPRIMGGDTRSVCDRTDADLYFPDGCEPYHAADQKSGGLSERETERACERRWRGQNHHA